MKNLDLMVIATIASFLVELYDIYINHRKPLPDRVKFDSKFIEYCSLILFPVIAFFLAFIMWRQDEYAHYNQFNNLIAANIGVMCGILIRKPLDLI